jgi:type IX secretion system PorP/SprF family membrane protein
MRNNLLLFFFCGLSVFAEAQQLPQYSQFAQNQTLYNPAFIGNQEKKEISIGGRWQMLGFGDEPRTAFGLYSQQLKTKTKIVVNPSLPISREIPKNSDDKKNKFSHGIGAQVSMDKYGAFGALELNGIYAFHFRVNKQLKLSGGAKLGIVNNSFDASRAIVSNVSDPTLIYQGGDTEYDEFISGKTNNKQLNLGIGGVVNYGNFFVSAAANNLIGNLIKFGNSSANFQTTPHLFISTGYKYSIGDALSINTVVLLKKMQPAPLSTELSIIANFEDNLFGGLIYRHKSAIGITGGFDINAKFRLGYSIDFSINRIRNVSNGGHELFLRYRF